MKLKQFVIEKQICMHISKSILPKQKINFKRFSQQYNRFLRKNKQSQYCFDEYLLKLFGRKHIEEIESTKDLYLSKKLLLEKTILQDFDLIREIYRNLGYSIHKLRTK